MASQEDKVRVASRISKELDVRVRQFYATSSSAIPKALELLASSKEGNDVKDDAKTEVYDVKKDEHDVRNDVINIGIDANMTSAQIEVMQCRIEEYKAQVQTLNAEIKRLQNVVIEAPDPVDLVRLQERNDGLNLVIVEKEKRIEDLTREVTTLNGFAHYFKTAEIKQIEAPAAEKTKPWWKFW